MNPQTSADLPLLKGALQEQDGVANINDSSEIATGDEIQAAGQGKVLGTTFEASPGSLLDVDVEDLIQRLHDVEMHDSAENSQKSTIYVPSDYSMQMQVDSQAYQEIKTTQKTREKLRLARGIPRFTSKKKKLQHGFDPVQVMRKHAISLPRSYPSRTSTLNNEILPMFRWENFNDCALDVYEQLKPALRLSSLFITHRASSAFWHTLFYGKRLPCEEMSTRYGRKCTRIKADVPWEKTKADELYQHLESLSKQVHFHFDLLKKASISPSYTYGYCNIVQDYTNPLPADNGCQKARVCLHTDFYTTAKRLSILDKRNVDPAMVLRFNFFLAVNITHEIAHFVELGHNYPVRLGEVFLNDDTWAECGAAFERKTFGGRIHPISARIDSAYGLATYDWSVDSEDSAEQSIHWTIPMTYIANIQQASTWDNAVGPTAFHIPRTGARSVFLCALDMTMWEEGDINIIDETSDGLNIPWMRLLNGNIVKNKNHGDVLRGTRSGRISKPVVRKVSNGTRASGNKPSPMRRHFRLSVQRRAIKTTFPKRSPAAKKGKQKKKSKAAPNQENQAVTPIASRNQFSVLESPDQSRASPSPA
ncbi:MAG: hypothetical protein M1821_003422 [Bathelium mastoideum]|nr:MAG: hypothetical protein M1821_003422 [Bathelium mastoideum]